MIKHLRETNAKSPAKPVEIRREDGPILVLDSD